MVQTRGPLTAALLAIGVVVVVLFAACSSPQATGSVGATEPVAASDTPTTSAMTKLAGKLRTESPDEVNTPTGSPQLPIVISQVDTDENVVFITIDDGGTADPEILAILEQAQIPVTPFQTVNVTQPRKDYFGEVARLTGQAVQNHTITHPQMPRQSFAEQKRQICETSDKYEQWYGDRPWMLRPPYGEFNDTTRRAAQECGIDYIVMWSSTLPAAHLRYQVGDSLRPGEIILTHWRHDLRDHLPKMLKDIARQGFRVGALQDYLPRRES